MNGLFEHTSDDSIYLSRQDPAELLGTYSAHAILLDGETWDTVEHYFQAMQFEDPGKQAIIRTAPGPVAAHSLGEPGFLARLLRRRRSNWKQLRAVYMTRALYIKCRTWPKVAERLLATGDKRLVEKSQYDYYWGCGRDLRGENMYGQVLMDIRNKLREEADS